MIEPASSPVIADLRSDTLTRPTPGMRRAMADAEVGDDVFEEDPLVNRLQAEVAERFGREAALFVPSGTMANQIAIRLHASPGDEVLAGRWAHSYLYEVGGAAGLSGVQITILGSDGLFTLEDVREEIKSENIHYARTRLVMFENTHNRGGGRIFPLDELDRIVQHLRTHGLRSHIDGARIFNASVASGLPVDTWGRRVDTLCFCLSKGLGAPIGSMLVGDRDAIREARRIRKLFGGGMRQVGMLAAAGLYALSHQVDRLAEDHAHASAFAEAVVGLPGLKLPRPPETNIVIFEVDHPRVDAAGLCQRLAQEGVRVLPMTSRHVRAVFHLDVSPDAAAQAAAALRRVVSDL